jgi:hypothetical protein
MKSKSHFKDESGANNLLHEAARILLGSPADGEAVDF